MSCLPAPSLLPPTRRIHFHELPYFIEGERKESRPHRRVSTMDAAAHQRGCILTMTKSNRMAELMGNRA
jgi:hypothetical protein